MLASHLRIGVMSRVPWVFIWRRADINATSSPGDYSRTGESIMATVEQARPLGSKCARGSSGGGALQATVAAMTCGYCHAVNQHRSRVCPQRAADIQGTDADRCRASAMLCQVNGCGSNSHNHNHHQLALQDHEALIRAEATKRVQS